MSPSWFSPETLVGVLAAIAFGVLCLGDLRRGVIVFTAAGCIRHLQIGAFAGGETVQGLLPVELLASVLVAAWLIAGQRSPLRSTAFNRWLFLLLPISALSLVLSLVVFDKTVAVEHIKMSVSLGQIVLTMWPIATYVVVASAVRDTRTIETIRRMIVVLALPSMVLMVAPGAWKWVDWSTSFALPASSLCFAECFETRSNLRRAGLLAVSVAPLIYGIEMDKAFYYGYVIVSAGVIACVKARKAVAALLPLAIALYVIAIPLASNSLTPRLFDELVEDETRQQSLGGTGGRERLIADGLGIWSRSPVLGVGPGNNYPYMLRYSSLGTAHNQYVNILIELGTIGMLCFAAFAIQAVRTGLALWRTARHPSHRVLVLGWLGMFGGFLAGGFFGDFMLPSIRNSGLELFAEFYVQWIVLGLIIIAAAIERRCTARSTPHVYA